MQNLVSCPRNNMTFVAIQNGPPQGAIARCSRFDSDMLVTRVLKNSQLACGESHAISRTGH